MKSPRLLLLAAALLCGACMVQRERLNVEDFHGKTAGVLPGKTTADELVAMVGSPPATITEITLGKKVYVYNFGDAKSVSLGVPLALLFTKTNRGVDTAIFVVDPNGVVEAVYASRNSADLEWEFWPFGD
ncbi:MAG: hypothetical protein K8I02_09525 [Candidatus Methylomirabilis sp.]|nr:hypothetical protein [Deltaproteobacteria bacterium]